MLHQVNCQSADGFTIDLHWRYVPWITRDGSGQDPGLWAQARPLDVVGHHALSPSPEDLLLLVILHAFRAGWATAPRWIADTSYLVRALGADLDWDRLVERTVSGHLVVPVRDALEFVADEFDVRGAARNVAPLRDVRPSAGGSTIATASRAREVTGERRAWVGELDDARTGLGALEPEPHAGGDGPLLAPLRQPATRSRTPRRDPRRRRHPRRPQREGRRPPRLDNEPASAAGYTTFVDAGWWSGCASTRSARANS